MLPLLPIFAVLAAVAIFAATSGGGEPSLTYWPAKGQLYPVYCKIVDSGKVKTRNQIVNAVWPGLYKGVPLPTARSPEVNKKIYVYLQTDVDAWMAHLQPCEVPGPPMPGTDPPAPVPVGPWVEPVPVPEPVGPQPAPTEPTGPVGPEPVPTEPTGPVGPEPVPTEPTMGDVEYIESLIRTDPVPGGGYFLVMEVGDYGVKHAGQIAPGANGIDVYMCMTTSKWNARLYGSEATPGEFSAYKSPEGVTWKLDRGYLPRHMDARKAMTNLQAPKRTINWKGVPTTDNAHSLMVAWVPVMQYDPTLGLMCSSLDPNVVSDDAGINPPQRVFDILGIDDVKVMG